MVWHRWHDVESAARTPAETHIGEAPRTKMRLPSTLAESATVDTASVWETRAAAARGCFRVRREPGAIAIASHKPTCGYLSASVTDWRLFVNTHRSVDVQNV